MNLVFSQRAWAQYSYWQDTDKAMVRKINALIRECLRHPFEGTGKPEPLKGDLSGFWSRRIDRELAASAVNNAADVKTLAEALAG